MLNLKYYVSPLAMNYCMEPACRGATNYYKVKKLGNLNNFVSLKAV